MNKYFFDKNNALYTFRWFIVIVAGFLLWEAYADYSGWRIVSVFNSEQQWSSTGARARHK